MENTRGNKKFIITGTVALFTSYCVLLFALYVQDAQKASVNGPAESHRVDKEHFIKEQKDSRLGKPIGKTPKKKSISTEKKPSPFVKEPAEVRTPRKEGVLWIDRRLSKCMVTLGSADGLQVGDVLNVFSDGKKVGETKIIELQDIISYTELVGKTPDDYSENYYQVHIR